MAWSNTYYLSILESKVWNDSLLSWNQSIDSHIISRSAYFHALSTSPGHLHSFLGAGPFSPSSEPVLHLDLFLATHLLLSLFFLPFPSFKCYFDYIGPTQIIKKKYLHFKVSWLTTLMRSIPLIPPCHVTWTYSQVMGTGDVDTFAWGYYSITHVTIFRLFREDGLYIKFEVRTVVLRQENKETSKYETQILT